MLTEDQLNSIAHWTHRGAEAGQASLREMHAADSGLEVRNIHCTSLAELPEKVACFDGECVAGVMSRFQGGVCGTALLAMDPEDALTWVRSNPGKNEDVLESFVRLGKVVQANLVSEIGAGLGHEVESSSAELWEDSVPLILLATRAPSDTAVVTVSILVAAGYDVLPMQIYLMIESKLLCTALAA
jgi:hypothetical protein